MVSDERALATWLAERNDVELARTFAGRGVPASAVWHDFFDAAEGLLDAASLDRALTRLPRRDLATLSQGGRRSVGTPHRPRADARGRPSVPGRRRPPHRAHRRPAGRRHGPHVELPPRADERRAAVAAERAFTTAGALADVLLACLHTPLARTGTGTISAADRKRLIESGAVGHQPRSSKILVESAAGAGLARAMEREWVVTEAGERWLEAPTARRWTTIARRVSARSASEWTARRGRWLHLRLVLGRRLPARPRVARRAPRASGASPDGGASSTTRRRGAAVERERSGQGGPADSRPAHRAPPRRDRSRVPAGRPHRDRPGAAGPAPRPAAPRHRGRASRGPRPRPIGSRPSRSEPA